jgi:hypothetical protein
VRNIVAVLAGVLALSACGEAVQGLPSTFPQYPHQALVRDSSTGHQVDVVYSTTEAAPKVDTYFRKALNGGDWVLYAEVGTTHWFRQRSHPDFLGEVDVAVKGGKTTIHITAS